MRSVPRPHVVAFGAAAFAALLGCGGGSKSPATAAEYAVAEPEAGTVEEAEARIARARRDLGLSAAPADPSAQEAASAPSAAPGAPPAAPPAQVDAVQAERAEKKSEAPKADADGRDDCPLACRAHASLARATASLCRLTGADDARCARARSGLREADAAVSRCGCR